MKLGGITGIPRPNTDGGYFFTPNKTNFNNTPQSGVRPLSAGQFAGSPANCGGVRTGLVVDKVNYRCIVPIHLDSGG